MPKKIEMAMVMEVKVMVNRAHEHGLPSQIYTAHRIRRDGEMAMVLKAMDIQNIITFGLSLCFLPSGTPDIDAVTE